MNQILAMHASFETLEALLHEVAWEIDAGAAHAPAVLAGLLDELRHSSDPRAVGLHVFADAMSRRLSGERSGEANLYLQRFEVPQIQLFNLLGRYVPFLGLATSIANNAIARAIETREQATVIDVGVGTGRQMCQLIEMLATAREAGQRTLRHLTVVGIEPGDEALGQAGRNIRATARATGIDVRFVPILGMAESLSFEDWTLIEEESAGRSTVVNASFALHHIADMDGRDQRDRVLRRLRALNPALLVLSEPDVDHLERGFYNRFRNCYAHFGAVFRSLDVLPMPQRDRNAIKVGFFGREICDILGNPDSERSERHESAKSWLRRLDATGYALRAHGELPAVDAAASKAIRVARHTGHVSIDAVNEPVVSVFVAAPAV